MTQWFYLDREMFGDTKEREISRLARQIIRRDPVYLGQATYNVHKFLIFGRSP